MLLQMTPLHSAAQRPPVRPGQILRRMVPWAWVAVSLLWGGPAGAAACEPPRACGGWATDEHWTQQGRGTPRERPPVQEYGRGWSSRLWGPA